MFIAIIIPPAKKNKAIRVLVVIAMLASLIFSLTPFLKDISSGFRIIILTVLIAAIAAIVAPVKDEEVSKNEC